MSVSISLTLFLYFA